MRSSLRALNVRSARNQKPAPIRFTSGLVSETGGTYQPADDEAVIAAALRIVASRVQRGSPLESTTATRQYLTLRFAGLEHEVFSCIYLDNRHRVIACEDLFRGTIDGASVHPREVVKAALAHNAAAVILTHNHPSGVSNPSSADEMITKRLKDALAIVDIRVLDHLIVAGASVYSFAEHGLL